MPSTFLHGFLPSTCLMTLKSKLPRLSLSQKLRLFAIAFYLGNSPDLDAIPGAIYAPLWSVIHRAWGHNIFALILWTVLGVVLIKKFVSKDFSSKALWLICGSLVFSHIVFDSLAATTPDGNKPGVPLFFPISRYEVTVPFEVFEYHRSDPKLNPVVAYFSSPYFWHNTLVREIVVMAICFILWGCLLFSANIVMKYLRPRASKKMPHTVPSNASDSLPVALSGSLSHSLLESDSEEAQALSQEPAQISR